MMPTINRFMLMLVLIFSFNGESQIVTTSDELELLDAEDINILDRDPELQKLKTINRANSEIELSELEELDDLESLKDDIGDELLPGEEVGLKTDSFGQVREKDGPKEISDTDKMDDSQKSSMKDAMKVSKKMSREKDKDVPKEEMIFDVGPEEKTLLDLSKFIEAKIPNDEWDDIATAAKVDKYVVQDGDWLWQISKRIFGSGFYYSKIWSLNPHITNPHEIEPGMVLVFDTGSLELMPQVSVNGFSKGKKIVSDDITAKLQVAGISEDAIPEWIKERSKLVEQGVYFQYASDQTYDDLANYGKLSVKRDYEIYDPPVSEILIQAPDDQYDSTGLDKNSKIVFNYKEGFFLSTFVTTNVVQDFGVIDSMEDEPLLVQKFKTIYVRFDSSVKVRPGDEFSIYSMEGKVSHPASDRKGLRYTILAQVKAVRPINHVWECTVTEITGLVERGARVTVKTPGITQIKQTFSKRNIEGAVVGSYRETANGMSFGDVIYLDRGRADGVELGNVFELYSFWDRGTDKRITPDPTYKIGEVTVITLTDNFATALISQSSTEIALGTIALSKTAEEAAKKSKLKNLELLRGAKTKEIEGLDELDVELSLDDINKDLLDRADLIKLTEDELAELERQEREKSVIKDHEKDLRELDKIETEIEDVEKALRESKLDEDKFLEEQSLEDIEKRQGGLDPNGFESLGDIEEEVGLKFMDEDLNSKENPYGLTEYDLEEIDELLNLELK
jgi:hypothetical protein